MPAPLTLTEYALTFLAAVAPTLRPTSRRAYRYALEHYVVPHLGTVPVAALTRRQVRTFAAELSVRLAPKTVRLIVAALSALLTAAVEDELAPAHVALRLRLPTTTVRRAPAFTAVQLDLFLDAVRATTPHALLFQLCAHAALRAGEARGLRRGDADLAARTLRITRTAHRRGEVGPPKDGPRVIALPPRLAAALEAHEAPIVPGAYDFAGPSGGPLSDTHVQRLFHDACDRAGLQRRGTHALRRSSLSLLLANGAPGQFVRQLAGHASLAQLAVYDADLPMVAPAAFEAW